MNPTHTTAATLFVAAALVCQEPQSQPSAAESRPASLPSGAGPGPYPVRGRSEIRYVGRWTEGATDQDLYNYSDFDLGDPRRHLITAHADFRLALDMDRDHSPGNPFRTVDDTYNKDFTARLYGGWLDFNGGVQDSPARGVISRVRLGRQPIYETPQPLYLDGLSVETAPADLLDLTFLGYVGSPSHLFETSREGDWSAGAAVIAIPWQNGRLRFDYMHVTDEYLANQSDDDLFGVSGSQKFGDWLRLDGYFNLLEAEARDLGLSATVQALDGDTMTLRYTGLLSDQTVHSLDLDYFQSFMATYFAYDQYELALHKALGAHAFVDGGVQLRELRHEVNEGIFNHEFRRYYLTPGVNEWPVAGLTVSVTGAWWDAGGERFGSFGAELQQRFDDAWTGALGTSFDLYRYDVLLGQERQDVQTSYAKVTWRASRHFKLRGGFTFEDGNDDDYYTVLLSVEVRP